MKKKTKKQDMISCIEEVLKKVFNCKWIYYALALLISIFLCWQSIRIKAEYDNSVFSKYSIFFYIGICVISILTITLLIFNNRKKEINIEKMYLIFAITLGILYVIISPVFTQSDESFHFIRAYQVSRFHFFSKRDNIQAYDYMPKSILDTLYDDNDKWPEIKNYTDSINENKIKLDKKNVIRVDVRASNYIFINYLPQAFGIRIGTILDLSPYMLGLLGRIFNLVACILLYYFGLKIIPIFKKTYAVILLMPTVISYAASMSADGLITAFAFLLIALVTKFIYEKKKMDWKSIILFLIIVTYVSTCKMCYLPLIGILLFIPKECFENSKKRYIFSISLIVYGVLCGLLWYKLSATELQSGVDYPFVTRMINFCEAYINSMISNAGSYLFNIVGGNYMYQNRVHPYIILPIIYLLLFISTIKSEEKSIELRYMYKVLTAGIIFIVVTLIGYALYFGNTTFGEPTIIGIQGRYYVPVILLLPLYIKGSKIKTNIKLNFDIIILINMSVLFTMLTTFIF